MRVYTIDNKPLDFCPACTPTENEAIAKYGPDEGSFSYDAEHPPYEDGYACSICCADLTPAPSSFWATL